MNSILNLKYLLLCFVGLLNASICQGKVTVSEIPAHEVSFRTPFITEIDTYSKKVLDEIYQDNPSNTRPQLESIRQRLIQQVKNFHPLEQIKGINPIPHLKHTFKEHGLGAVIATGAAEGLTNIALPYYLSTIGYPSLAAISLLTPTWAVAAPTYIKSKILAKQIVKNQKSRIKNQTSLDRLRRKILGKFIKYRVMTILLKTAQEEYNLNIIDQPKFLGIRRSSLDPRQATVSVQEIQGIALSVCCQNVAEQIIKSDLDPVLKVYHLLDEISRHPEASEILTKLIKNRIERSKLSSATENQKILLNIQNQITQTNMLIRSAMALKTNLQRINAKGIHAKQKITALTLLNRFLQLLDQLKTQIVIHEYRVISQMSQNQPLTDVDKYNSVEHALFHIYSEIDSIKRDSKKLYLDSNYQTANDELTLYIEKIEKAVTVLSPNSCTKSI